MKTLSLLRSSLHREISAVLFCAALLGALLPVPAHAGLYEISRAELAALPEYCLDSEVGDSYKQHGPRWNYWVGRMGPQFNAIHHYCYGMVLLQRAHSLPARDQTRVRTAKQAIREFDYLLRSSARNFPLLPEMLTRRGDAAVVAEDWGLAYDSFSEAWTVKPDYWPPYLAWGNALAKVGNKKDALSTVRGGLAQVPNAEPLRRLYVQLGGSLKDIPEAKPIPPNAAASAASAPDAAASTPDPVASASGSTPTPLQ